MLTVEHLEGLYELRSPLLTAYIHTDPVETATSGGPTSGYPAWGRDESQTIVKGLPSAEQKTFLSQVERVRGFLQKRAAHEKSLVILAGPRIWEVIPLQVKVQPALHWGKPALAQLISLVSQHRRYGVLTIDHAGARFFTYSLGEIADHEERKFAIDISQWKKKQHGHMAAHGVIKSRGIERDVFQKHVEDRYARLCRETAQQAAKFCAGERLAALFLTGPSRLIEPVRTKLPKTFVTPTVLFDEDLARMTLAEIKKHIEPKIAEWECKHERETIDAVTSEERGTVTGFDETLAQLQRGKIRTLVVARGLDPELHQCVQCGWTDRSADPVCVACGGARKWVMLWDVLPELARRHEIEIEVVGNGAAEGLRDSKGMAGWLRRPKAMSARSSH